MIGDDETMKQRKMFVNKHRIIDIDAVIHAHFEPSRNTALVSSGSLNLRFLGGEGLTLHGEEAVKAWEHFIELTSPLCGEDAPQAEPLD